METLRKVGELYLDKPTDDEIENMKIYFDTHHYELHIDEYKGKVEKFVIYKKEEETD